jgi:chromate transporter
VIILVADSLNCSGILRQIAPRMHLNDRAASGLVEIAALFLRLGATAFGGPAAHIAMMEAEVVGRRRWLSRDEFLDYLGITNLIPGPNSTELAIEIGFARAGWLGLVVAGVSFVVPAALIVTAIAWMYVRYGRLPEVAGILHGLYPVVIAIVAHALWQLGRTAIKSARLAVFAAASVAAIVLGAHELAVLAAVGLLNAAARGATRLHRASLIGGIALSPSASIAVAAAQNAPATLTSLFLTFLKIGAVLFGSGYVLLAFLRADFVERLGWLTEQQLLDAVAVGQITPGPLFTTATFVGFLVAGGAGAFVATVGIFLPAFVFVAAVGPFVPQLRRSPVAGAVLDGVNVASLALMAVVTWQLARSTLVSPVPVVACLACALLLARYSINTTWLILGGAIVGWAMGR